MRRLIYYSATFALGILLALGVGEFVVRGFRLEGDQFFEPDPYLGWVHRRGFRGTYVSEEAVNADVRINAHGLLGPDRAYERRPGVRRILLLGDSYTESMQVPYEETWGSRLERSLGSGWEVINAGVAGYGIDNTYLALQREYRKYQPDVVLLLFFTGNDVSDNDGELYGPDRGSRPKPWFTWEDGKGLTLHGSPMPLPKSLKGRLKSQLRQRSHFYRFVKDRFTHLRTARGYTKGTEGGIPRPWYVYCKTPRVDFDRAWLTTSALIHAIHVETDSMGTILAAGILPTDWRIEPDQMQEVLTRYPAMADTSVWDFALPDRKAEAMFAAEGIPAVDLTPALQEERRSSDVALYADHLTSPGHEVVARHLMQLLGEAVLPPSVSGATGESAMAGS